jgi:hypothetical protein
VQENAIDASRKGRSNIPSGQHLERVKKAIKAKWADPVFKKERLAVLAQHALTPEFRMAVKAGMHAAKHRS